MKLSLTSATCIAFVLAITAACGSTSSNETSRSGAANNSAGDLKTSAPANTSAAPAPPRKADITTTAETLYKEYKSDPKTMEKYKGKIVEISGKFSRTSGSANSPEVVFDTGDPGLWVTCRLNASAFQAAAKLEKGQAIKMSGIGDPASIIGPLFKDCEMSQ